MVLFFYMILSPLRIDRRLESGMPLALPARDHGGPWRCVREIVGRVEKERGAVKMKIEVEM
jgi:hypothetical protein